MIRRQLWVALLFVLGTVAHAQSCVTQSQVTVTGSLRASNGLPSSNASITMQPSQVGIVAGCMVNTMATTACATSVDGSVVQSPNPLAATITSTTGTGTLPSGTYYVTYAWYDALGHVTLTAPETVQQLSAQGSLAVSAPAGGVPDTAVGMNVYIGTARGMETLQGQTVGGASFNKATPLVAGSALPGTNNTVCVATANDTIWPTGTGYIVTMEDSSGNALPGYPMQWQLNGPGTSINLSQGLPYYHGVVFYPTPILSAPQGHVTQSISGPLNMGGYSLLNVGAIGVGTALPAWPVDVENGAINASGGFILNGGAGVATGNCLTAGSDAFHTFDVPATCLTSATSLFYQTVTDQSTPLPQRGILNFTGRFGITDEGGTATLVDVNSTSGNSPGQPFVVTTASMPGSTTDCARWDGSGGLTTVTCASPTPTVTAVDVTGSRSFGTTFHNTGGPMMVSGFALEGPSGSGIGQISCQAGPSTPSMELWASGYTSTNIGTPAGFSCLIPQGYFYEITKSGDIAALSAWIETTFN